MNAKQISFSIKGPFITRLAREKLESGDFGAAYRLIAGCTKSDSISESEHRLLVYDILSGRKKITGTYPGDDYGVIDDPDFKTDLIGEAFDTLKTKLEQKTEKLTDLKDKYEFIRDCLREDYYSIFCELEENYQDIEEKPLFNQNSDFSEKQHITPYINQALKSFLRQAKIEKSQSDDDCEKNYGWLRPDGHFFPVLWGEHETWAAGHLDKYYPKEKYPHLYKTDNPETGESVNIYGGDVLRLNLGWALLHSPYRGVAQVTRSELKPLTNAMKSFLYEYYTSRGLKKEAAWYEKGE